MSSLEEKDNTPLADTEISRLIKVSREIGYKKQDQIPERNLMDFKPLTIDKIATQVSVKQRERGDTNVTDKQEKKPSIEVTEKSNEEKEQLPQEEDTKTTDVKLDELAEEATDNSVATDEIIEDSNNKQSTNEENKEPKTIENDHSSSPNENNNEEVARQEGIEIGKKMALSEIQIEQREVIDTLKTLVNNLKAKEYFIWV